MTTTEPPEHDDGTDDRAAASRTLGTRRRVVPLVTAVAAAALALIHAGDLVQLVLGLPYTANDVVPASLGYLREAPEIARGLPLNLLQTLVTAVLTAVVLIGGALCIGRRGAAVRLGGVLAALTAVLPATMPLLIAPLVVHSARIFSWPAWFDVVLYTLPGSALLAAVLAGVLLLVASRHPAEPAGRARFPLPAILAGAVFAAAAIAALVQMATMYLSWWAFGLQGVVGTQTWQVLLLIAGLTAALVMGTAAAGRLLAAASPLARIGGGLLLAAVLLRILTQLLLGGLAGPLLTGLPGPIGPAGVSTLDLVPAIGVTVLAVLGVLFGVLGLFRGGRGGTHPPA